jgi:hypothetical protein
MTLTLNVASSGCYPDLSTTEMCSEMTATDIVVIASESVVERASDHQIDDETIFGQSNDLVRSLAPMLRMMRIWGLYFGRHGRFHVGSQSHGTELQDTEQVTYDAARKRSTGHRSIYPKIVLIILWTNVLRVAITFRRGQELDAVTIGQTTLFVTNLQYAIMQTSYFVASHSGKFDEMLNRLRVTGKFVDQVRKYAIACVVYNSLVSISSLMSGIYTIFMSEDTISFVLTPFTTLIPVDGIRLKVVRIFALVVNFFALQASLWPLLMNIMLTAILSQLFREVNNRFRSKLNPRGEFTGNLKTFRHRHQVLSEIVQTTDSFMNIGNVATITCQMIIVILILYETSFIGYADTLTAFMFYSWFLQIVLSLSICIFSGVMINEMVSYVLRNITSKATFQVSAECLSHL